jgi:hypothetical protein
MVVSRLSIVVILVQDDSKLLSAFPFIGHGNPNSNLESLCMIEMRV